MRENNSSIKGNIYALGLSVLLILTGLLGWASLVTIGLITGATSAYTGLKNNYSKYDY